MMTDVEEALESIYSGMPSENQIEKIMEQNDMVIALLGQINAKLEVMVKRQGD